MYFPRLPIIADGSRRSAVFRPSRAPTIIAVGFLLLFYLHHFFSARVSSSRDIHARSVTPYNDNNRHVHSQKVFDDPTPLSTFLCRHGLDNDETVFLTIASKEYMPQTLNFKASLKRWKLDRRYAVLCLDVECLSVSKENGIVAYDGYIMSPEEAKGNWHVPVARLKFAANIDLLDGGYNFLVIDGDVYLTGTHHPLAQMHPLEQGAWHIQFQSDRHNGQNSEVNIGWYWVRPTPIIREYFLRSQRAWLANTTEWDQRIMNDVRHSMIEQGALAFPASVVLNLDSYRATMRYDWGSIYGNETAIDAMNNQSVIVHYTEVFGIAKLVLAKQFGHWVTKDYYIDCPKILRPVGIYGNTNETLNQIALAVHLAKVTGRKFMWPNSVNHTCPQYKGGWKESAPILIADADSLANVTDWVEGTYLRNRNRFQNDKVRQKMIHAASTFDFHSHSVDKLVKEIMEHKDVDIVSVDFEGVNAWKLDEWDGVAEIVQGVGIKACERCSEMAEYGRVEYIECFTGVEYEPWAPWPPKEEVAAPEEVTSGDKIVSEDGSQDEGVSLEDGQPDQMLHWGQGHVEIPGNNGEE